MAADDVHTRLWYVSGLYVCTKCRHSKQPKIERQHVNRQWTSCLLTQQKPRQIPQTMSNHEEITDSIRSSAAETGSDNSGIDWRDTYSTVEEQNLHLLEEGIGTDCVIVVGPEDEAQQEFRAHRIFLVRSSEVFEAMLLGKMSEATTGYIRVTDLSPRTFQLLLRYIYGNCIDVNCTEACDVILAANKYQIRPLVQVCVDRVCRDLTPKKLCYALRTANFVNHKTLQAACLAVLRNDTAACIGLNDFLQLPEDCVALLLQQDELNVENELMLVNAVVAWSRCEAQRRGLTGDDANVRDVLKPRLLKLLRLLTLSQEQFVLGPGLSGWLTDEEKHMIAACHYRSDYSLLPDHISSNFHPRINTNACSVFVMHVSTGKPCNSFTQDVSPIIKMKALCNGLQLLGVTFMSQIKGDSASVEHYIESVDIEAFEDKNYNWFCVRNVKFTGNAHYNSKITVLFPQPLQVQKNAVFAVQAHLKVRGTYPELQEVVARCGGKVVVCKEPFHCMPDKIGFFESFIFRH